MKKIFLTVCFMLVMVSAPYAGANLSVMMGEKFITSGDLKPANEQSLRAVRFDIGTNIWLANIAIDYYAADYNEMRFINTVLTDVDVKTEEIRLGLRGYYGKTFRLFAGGGVVDISMSRKLRTSSGSVNCSGSTGIKFFSNGVWGELGADYVIANNFLVGLSASYSDGNIKCGEHKVNIGGASGGAYLGITW